MSSVHSHHCCVHYCKYGDDDCPIMTGEEEQEIACQEEDCPRLWSIRQIRNEFENLEEEDAENLIQELRLKYVAQKGDGKSKRTGWFGFSEESEFLHLKYKELIDMISGRLIMSIGRGQFKEELYSCIGIVCGWALYNDKGM